MIKYNISAETVIDELKLIFGDINVKSLFTGYGFYLNEHMFAIYDCGGLFLRAENELAEDLIEMGALKAPKSTNYALSENYYSLPLEIRENVAVYNEVISRSVQQIKQNKILLKNKQKKKIRNMINLSINHERLLLKIDIKSVQELKKIGAEEAFCRLKQLEMVRSISYYWLLKGAIENKHILLYTEEEKSAFLKELNKRLMLHKMKIYKR